MAIIATPGSAAPQEGFSLHSFYVHLSEGPTGGGHLVTDAEDCFEAALLFAERWAPEPDDGDALRVQVTDSFTGERWCFVIDLGAGEVKPC